MKIINNKQKALKELKRISKRTTSGDNKKINSVVEEILQEVKIHGDKAVEKYTKKFDGFLPKPMQVSAKDLKTAWDETDDQLKKSNPNSPIATTLESPWAASFKIALESDTHLLASRGCKPTE